MRIKAVIDIGIINLNNVEINSGQMEVHIPVIDAKGKWGKRISAPSQVVYIHMPTAFLYESCYNADNICQIIRTSFIKFFQL